jgi:3-oxoacyl-[acyl-carrier protein] reductase
VSLDGRVAVVTGGANGIGAAVAQGLAQDGATVEIFDLAVGRPGRPEDISDCVRFLVRPESSWITGQTFNVDGGHRYH